MNATLRQLVRERAGHRCEYCQLHQDDSPLAALHTEHIRPRKHGGSDDLSNLCLACIDCNLHKGPNLTGVDPETDGIVELFNPRHSRWDDHFRWQGIRVMGLTPQGRTTIQVLDLNGEDRLDLRQAGS